MRRHNERIDEDELACDKQAEEAPARDKSAAAAAHIYRDKGKFKITLQLP